MEVWTTEVVMKVIEKWWNSGYIMRIEAMQFAEDWTGGESEESKIIPTSSPRRIEIPLMEKPA